MGASIVVAGSYNVGLFLKGRTIPAVAETVIGDEFFEGGGGKGSNQAVAASLMGADVSFIGRIGLDKYGEDALNMYRRLGISAECVFADGRSHTGISVILIDAQGKNSIMVVPGSNYLLDQTDIDRCKEKFRAARITGFQLENRLETVAYGLRSASEADAQTLLDPAPATPLPDEIYPFITYIKPNEVEAATLSGIPVTDFRSAEQAGRWFLARGVKHALVTLGGQGAVLVDQQGARRFSVPALSEPVVDTTGAGDTFSGAFMAALAEDKPIDDAVRFAICASALSVTRRGVVEAIPSRAAVDTFYNKAYGA